MIICRNEGSRRRAQEGRDGRKGEPSGVQTPDALTASIGMATPAVRLNACDSRARSDEIESSPHRHARAETPRRVTRRGPRLRGHPRLSCGSSASKTWMAGTSPAMTPEKWLKMTGRTLPPHIPECLLPRDGVDQRFFGFAQSHDAAIFRKGETHDRLLLVGVIE